MAKVTREQLLDSLENGWENYVDSFLGFSPEQQAEFLARQGYPRLSDLLAHVIAWWEAGEQTVRRLIEEPGYQPPRYDVDRFNLEAVDRFHCLEESDVIQLFDTRRKAWIAWIHKMPEADLQNGKINRQLDIEIIEHLKEHAIDPC